MRCRTYVVDETALAGVSIVLKMGVGQPPSSNIQPRVKGGDAEHQPVNAC